MAGLCLVVNVDYILRDIIERGKHIRADKMQTLINRANLLRSLLKAKYTEPDANYKQLFTMLHKAAVIKTTLVKWPIQNFEKGTDYGD